MNQPTNKKHSVKHFAKHALHEILHLDNKLVASLHDLVFKPGLLTKDYFNNETSRYMKPLGLFIFVNFLFFILKNPGMFQYNLSAFSGTSFFDHYINEHLQAKKTYEVFEAKFNTSMRLQQKSYFIFLVPLFALTLKLLYWKRYYVEHLMFAFETFTFFLLYLLFTRYIIMLVYYVSNILNVDLPSGESTDILIILPLFLCWLIKALQTFYEQKKGWSILKGIVLGFMVLFLLSAVYRTAVFFIVLHAI
jgi:hypothetical protein